MTRRILVSGETLIDFLPETVGSLECVETFSRRAGGAPANLAVGLARLGEDPWFWTRIGSDPMGDYLAAVLASNDIPDRFIERDSTAKTTLAFVSHDESADRSFTFYRDGTADTRLEAGRVSDDALAAVEWVVIGGVALASEPARTATLDLARRAYESGCTVVFDPNARPELWQGSDMGFDQTIESALQYTDVLKATPDDLHEAGFDSTDAETLARTVCGSSDGPHTVLLTLGSKGAMLVSSADAPWGETTVTHPGYAVDPVDSTGAGDAFLTGFLAARASGEQSPIELLEFANAVAALTTTEPGAMTALPERENVAAFRAEHSPE
ncbi:carbohydrate kinase family protein [Halocatena marina]|uniref:Carbohydrate kinase family protein n=1 Tax=Halocatena marina TaxID=2934937 RepID=A0ABD5YM37_9EURY|nr:carbohydrate kinase [Halocatena marina]